MPELHPSLSKLLQRRREQYVPPINALSVSSARQQHRELRSTDSRWSDVDTDEFAIDGPEGNLRLRVYRPNGDGPFPVLLWMHGGGFVLGDLDTSESICNALAYEANCLVVSVDYRLAPEHPFPAAAKDCDVALRWTDKHIGTYGGDTSRIAIGGDSAGGNLAAVTALQARDWNGPELVHQLLVYPLTAGERSLPSRRENAQGYGLTTEEVRWFLDHYTPDRFDRAHPYAYPLQAGSLSELPAATVLTAEFDPLRDDGRRYATRLRDDGVSTTTYHYDNANHGFFSMVSDPDVEPAREALSDVCTELQNTFDS